MDHLNVLTKYCEGKLASVAWCSVDAADLKALATGTYDGEVTRLSFWAIPRPRRVGPFEAAVETTAEPASIVTVLVDAAVTKLVPLEEGFLCMTDESGSLTLLNAANPWEHEPQLQHKWEGLHRFGSKSNAACNGVAVNQHQWATVGDDGRLNILDANTRLRVRTFGDDGARPALNGVVFQQDATVLTVSSAGVLQMWDTRAPLDAAIKNMRADSVSLGEDNLAGQALHSLAVHPHQPTAVLTGGSDGVLGLWDTRHEQFPRALKQAHTADVWDVQFHPVYPDNVFTAGEDGALLHWDTNPARTDARSEFHLSADPTQLHTTNLVGAHSLGVNSVAVDAEYVACGTDNEALLVFTNVAVQ